MMVEMCIESHGEKRKLDRNAHRVEDSSDDHEHSNKKIKLDAHGFPEEYEMEESILTPKELEYREAHKYPEPRDDSYYKYPFNGPLRMALKALKKELSCADYEHVLLCMATAWYTRNKPDSEFDDWCEGEMTCRKLLQKHKSTMTTEEYEDMLIGHSITFSDITMKNRERQKISNFTD